MARILSISYDETLLRTRELMLKGAGHTTVSALGYHDGRVACGRGNFDLIIIGHSIPEKDKVDLIVCFREANPGAQVIALTRAGEHRLKEVDAYLSPGEPEELIRAIGRILHLRTERWDSSRRA